MDFIELETFLAVAETLNLTKAAETLFVSQSTITHRLKKLEEELQYKLFLRQKGKRSIALTLRGEEFMSIASVDSVILTELPPILRELSKQEYGINVTIQTEHTPQIYELVRKREADIGFASAEAQLPEIETVPVFRQRYVLVRPCKEPGSEKQIHPLQRDPFV